MNPSQIAAQANEKFEGALLHFEGELKKLRTGRAHPSMLDSVLVEVYGTQMPLNQAATITVADAQLLQISPFDPNNLHAIANAIRNSQALGLNPTDDGRVVRVPIPPLTEERRRDIAKSIGQKQEECMVSLRNTRHDALSAVDHAKKDKLLGEDDAKRLEKQIDEVMNRIRERVEAAAKTKEREIMSV